ncbi:MFS transporter [Microbacterium sp. NPDC078428]|uniref:MFS transporter n=1 Tax=Microbacterium sp. NPDC078428 TaxID=3364190 RepID=UPI0037C5117B
MTGPGGEDPPRRPATAAALVFAVAVTGLGALPVWMLSAYAPAVQSDLGFDSRALGLAIGCFFAFSTLTGLPMGRLVQHLQWRRGVALTAILAGISLATIAVLAQSIVALILLLCVGAIANSTSQPAGNLAIASSISDRKQGLAFGVKQAALPISTFLIGLSVPLFGGGQDWRSAYLSAAGMAAVVLVAAGLPRAGRAWRERAHLRKPVLGRALRPPLTVSSIGPGVAVPRALVLLAVGAGFGTAVTISLGGFTVSYATAQGFSAAEAGQLLAVASGIGILSRVLSGYLADRRGRRHLVVVAAMMAAGAVGMVVLAFAGSTLGGMLVGIALAFGLGWAWNGVFHLSVVRYSKIPAAVATSVVQTAMSFGATFGPPLFGVVAAASFPAAWMASAAGLLLAAAFILLGRRELRRPRAQ